MKMLKRLGRPRSRVVFAKGGYDLQIGQTTRFDKHAVLYLGHGEETHPTSEVIGQDTSEQP
jgi:hypothetical protein